MKRLFLKLEKTWDKKKSGLEKGDILAFFVNDIEDYLPKDKKN